MDWGPFDIFDMMRRRLHNFYDASLRHGLALKQGTTTHRPLVPLVLGGCLVCFLVFPFNAGKTLQT
ncbi:MAG: hypothetical protein ACJAXQ_000016 [Parvibaculaceae bacterium]|jgi:hypothetical protein